MYNPENNTYIISRKLFVHRISQLRNTLLLLNENERLAYHVIVKDLIKFCNSELVGGVGDSSFMSLTSEYIITLNEQYKLIRKKIREQNSL